MSTLALCLTAVALAAASTPPPKSKPLPKPAAPPALPAPKAAPAAEPAKRIFPFPVERHALPNGLQVLFVKFDSPGLATYFSLVRTGSRNEIEPGHSGFAHFFEHMMFRGTERHPKEEYDALLSKAGVSNNAFTTEDMTAYHAFGPSRALPLIIELEADRFQNLKYAEDDFRTEAKAVLGEYNKNFSNPARKMDEVLHDTAYTVHPYKHTVMGFKQDIEAMPTMYEYSLEFFRRWYRPDNVVLLVVGDFDHAMTLELIKKAYGPWQGKAAKIEIPAEPKQTAMRAVNFTWQNPTQPRLVLAWHAPEARVDTKWAALQNVLGPYLFGQTSPLFRELVLERQSVLGLDSLYYDHRDPSLFGVFTVLKDSKDFTDVRKAMEDAIADLQAGRVDANRLEAVKSNQKYGLLNSFDNPKSVAHALVFAIGPTGDPDALDALFAHMEKIGPQDLVEFSRTYLTPANLTLITLVGPGSKPPEGIPEYRPSTAQGGAR